MTLRLLLLSSFALAPTVLAASAKVQFNRDIRPIFSDTCFHCHGFDAKAREAGLRLDIREEALKKNKDGTAPIVPGKPEASGIIGRIFATDKDDIMPPPKAHKELALPFPPEIEVESPYLQERKKRAQAQLDAHLAAARARPACWSWRPAATNFVTVPLQGTISQTRDAPWKFVSAGRRNQHAGRVCSPESRSRADLQSNAFTHSAS